MPAPVRIDKVAILRTALNADAAGWRLHDHVDTTLNNGVGRYVNQLQRLTITFCKEDAVSAGVRAFIKYELSDFAARNPGTVIYVMPRRHNLPLLIGEFLNGRQVHQNCKMFTRDDMNRWVNYMRARSGRPIAAWQRHWRTEQPSVQGLWTPFTNDTTDAQMFEFPAENLSRHLPQEATATEEVLRLFEEQQKYRQSANHGQSSVDSSNIHVIEESRAASSSSS